MFNENLGKIFQNHIWPCFTTSEGYRERIWGFKEIFNKVCVPACPLTIGRQCHRSMHTLAIKLSFLWLPSLSLFFFLLLFIFSHHRDFSLCDKQSYRWSELVCAEHSVTEPSRFLAQGTVFTLWTVKQLLFSLLWPLSPFINRFSQQMALEVLCWIH